MQTHGPGAVMMPADLASLSQQGYVQQQRHLAQAQMMASMMARQNATASVSGSEGGTKAPSHKKKKPKPSPQVQTMPRHSQHIAPPYSSEHYLKQAMSGPGEIEPWADGVDEVDPRELAMGRFRARQEILAEVFGPENIKDIPLGNGDPWEGLGMDGETLEAKVKALEGSVADLEAKMDEEVDGSRPTD
ncbi:MAG: hypothetical protein TREMPRED_004664 [Tremellales sp. Tagirdzhanova-0007]|nr:MAG: hypothetical protein TREMPRED_004664 [Tremellales sp. Tagirdzhanova-0007]